MHGKIIDLFAEIAKPFKDKEGGPKLDAVQKWLNDRELVHEYIPGIGTIINPLENPRIILVSHMDLIRKFQKGFAEGNTHQLVTSNKGVEQIKGALDNTITNAVALLALEELLERNITDIELVLTEGEEVGMHGMEAYIKAHPLKSRASFFVNLDVTNEGWKKHISIEFDKPSFHILKRFQQLLETEHTHYTTSRVGDDTDAILENDCFGFSYCLPTKETIHSYENKATLESLTGYFNGLVSILEHLDITGYDETFKTWHFKKALELNDFTEFDELIKKELRYERPSHTTNVNYGYSRYRDQESTKVKEIMSNWDDQLSDKSKKKKEKEKKPFTSTDRAQRERFVVAISEWLFKKHKIKDENQQAELAGFIEMTVMEDEPFFLSDFAMVFKKEKDPMITAVEILDELVEFGSVEEMKGLKYRFCAEFDF
jgi:hypothetical protein